MVIANVGMCMPMSDSFGINNRLECLGLVTISDP